ncbi:MAG: YihY family inner membrane protein [Burkholderiales bacterium]|nr:YihY family inner membrane protein [Pseudomonadota bacterium]MCZ2134846.1 YihY family inner membrane protein [Burkholderiales bacterium]
MIFWRALRRFLRGDGMVFAGYLAFLTLLGTLPALAILFWLSQQSILIRSADGALREFLYGNLFPSAAQQVIEVVERLRANARGLGQTGVILVFADLAVKALTINTAIDRIWGAARRNAWHHLRGVLLVLVLVPFVVGAVAWALQFSEHFTVRLLPALAGVAHYLFDPLQIGVPLVLGLALLYRWVPVNVRDWRSPFTVALCVTLLLVAARFVIGQYLAHAQQLKSLYGAFIAIPLLLITVFVIWALVLYGGALVAEGFGGRARAASR